MSVVTLCLASDGDKGGINYAADYEIEGVAKKTHDLQTTSGQADTFPRSDVRNPTALYVGIRWSRSAKRLDLRRLQRGF